MFLCVRLAMHINAHVIGTMKLGMCRWTQMKQNKWKKKKMTAQRGKQQQQKSMFDVFPSIHIP